MSLDVYLTLNDGTVKSSETSTGVYTRENGQNRELTWDEAVEKFPGLEKPDEETVWTEEEVFWANITHNLGRMAHFAGLYKPLWRPEELGLSEAKQLIPYLEKGVSRLKANPMFYKQFNPKNGWGRYENLVEWTEDYLKACKEYPEALVEVSR